MDPVEAAHRLLASLDDARAIRGLLAKEVLPPRDANGPVEVLEVVMKRNLVLASWRRDGPPEQTGTWVLAFDRDGRVVQWATWAATV